MSRYLKQKTGRILIPSKKLEVKASELNKPRSVSFELYSKEDTGLNNALLKYETPIPPTEPNFKDMNAEQQQIEHLQYKQNVKIYKNNLLPKFFTDGRIMAFPENVMPNCVLVMEKYQHVLAAALYDLSKNVYFNIHKYFQS